MCLYFLLYSQSGKLISLPFCHKYATKNSYDIPEIKDKAIKNFTKSLTKNKPIFTKTSEDPYIFYFLTALQ